MTVKKKFNERVVLELTQSAISSRQRTNALDVKLIKSNASTATPVSTSRSRLEGEESLSTRLSILTAQAHEHVRRVIAAVQRCALLPSCR